MNYVWPILVGGIFQLSWNLLLMVPCHGRFNSGFCDWVYGRYCDYGLCGGRLVLVIVWGFVAALFVINGAMQFRSR